MVMISKPVFRFKIVFSPVELMNVRYKQRCANEFLKLETEPIDRWTDARVVTVINH